jgi:hypothetical protein
MDFNQVQEKIKAKADKNSVQILLLFQHFAVTPAVCWGAS